MIHNGAIVASGVSQKGFGLCKNKVHIALVCVETLTTLLKLEHRCVNVKLSVLVLLRSSQLHSSLISLDAPKTTPPNAHTPTCVPNVYTHARRVSRLIGRSGISSCVARRRV